MAFTIKLPPRNEQINATTTATQSDTSGTNNAAPSAPPQKPGFFVPGKQNIQTSGNQTGQVQVQTGGASAGTAEAPAEKPKFQMQVPGINKPVASTAGLAASIGAEQFQFASQTNGMTEATAEGFRETLDLLANCFADKDMVGTVLRRIMVDLDNHPEFEEIMHPQDCGMMVKALRESYGVALIRKETNAKTKKPKITGPTLDMGDLQSILMGSVK